MKKYQLASSVLLISVLLIIVVVWVWRCCNPTVAPQIRFETNPAGALTLIRDKDGDVIYGEGKPINEGYFIAYQVLKNDGEEAIGADKIIQATSSGYTLSSIRCPECEKRQSEYEKTTVALSTDNAMLVNTNFVLDPSTNRLKVYRLIQNISNDPEINNPIRIKLTAIQLQYDQSLAGADASIQAGNLRAIDASKPKSTSKISQKLNGVFFPTAQAAGDACQFCPTQCDFSVQYSAKEHGEICVDCPELNAKERVIGVQFNGGKLVSTHPEHTPQPVNCEYKISVQPFVLSSAASDTLAHKPDETQIACITCPKKNGDIITPFSMKCFMDIGSLLSPTQIRLNNGCDISVKISESGGTFGGMAIKPSRQSIPASYSFAQKVDSESPKPVNEMPTSLKSHLGPGEGVVFVVEYDLGKKER